jgi:uncharacterized protein (DUF1778 family)
VSNLQSKVSAYDKFLSGLRIGDKVLICHKDGNVFSHGTVSPATTGKSFRIRVFKQGSDSSYYPEEFSRKTGKQHGVDYYIQPYGEERYQAHVEEIGKKKAAFFQQAAQREHERRAPVIQSIMATADMIDEDNLGRLSDSELRSLMTILNKLGEPAPELDRNA